jgi:Lon protease-like protein
MNCSEIDLNDYFFGEAPEAEAHVTSCAECSAGLDQLRATRAVLLTLREEEPPQRIGFVSDKIFEPSPLRRFFADFWLSGARLGFASAAMRSVALLAFSARTQPKVIERQVQVASNPGDVNAAVAKAVNAAMAEQEKKYQVLLQASDRKHQLQEQDLAMRVADYTTMLDKTLATNNKMRIAYNPEQVAPR